MTVEEIEDAAMAGRIPAEMTGAEHWLFLCLRRLHCDYRGGYITREQGAHEKLALLEQFRRYCFQDKLRLHAATLWRDVEQAANAYQKERTLEHADGLIKAIYGVGIPKEDNPKRLGI